MASRVTSSLDNSETTFREAQVFGVTNPPRITASTAMLAAASGNGLDLLDTKVDTTARTAAIANSRRYKGVAGLRQVQIDQNGYSALQPATGWIYKPSSGINPEINRGAFGTADGPLDKTADPMPGGAKWYWDLAKAEKDISTRACANANKCSQMRLLGEFQDICGYCKTSGAVVPVQRLASGIVTARYPRDPNLTCRSEDIVTTSRGTCPPEVQGFVGGRSHGRGEEGFATMNDIANCTVPLSRDCMMNAARFAGCRDEGTLITSLQGTMGGDKYDKVISGKASYAAYKSAAIPNFTPAMFNDGSVTMSTALDDFGRLVKNTSAGETTKLGASARDLCLKAGAFDAYNFCSEMTPTTLITPQNIVCLQRDWKNEGGTEAGRGYPTLNTWNGKRYQQYLNYTDGLFKRLQGVKEGFVNVPLPDKPTNAAAILEFTGADSSAPPLTNDFPRNDNTRGAETVWIHLGEVSTGTAPPTILRCDLKLAKDGPVLPAFSTREQLMAYGVPADNIGFTTAFEFRRDTQQDMYFLVSPDDGFMIGVNQNPFEGTGYARGDWGSWRYQGASWYVSTPVRITEESKKKTNTIVIKYFEGYGGVSFLFRWWAQGLPTWQDPNNSFAERSTMYLTQEPLAPWLNYEVCSRPNLGAPTTMGLYERRWNGQSAISYGGKAIPSFDVDVKGVAITAPKGSGRGYVSFTSSSSWTMRARLGFNAVRTLSLLINPRASLSPNTNANILCWYNYSTGKGVRLSLRNSNGQYQLTHTTTTTGTSIAPISVNEWNYVVLQVVSDGYGVQAFNVSSAPVSALQTASGLTSFVNTMVSRQRNTGSYITGSAANDANESAQMRIGSLTRAQYPDIADARGELYGFEGDLAFIHGFRDFMNTSDLVKADVQGSWMTRWPRGNA
jgi:hypothetical protein